MKSGESQMGWFCLVVELHRVGLLPTGLPRLVLVISPLYNDRGSRRPPLCGGGRRIHSFPLASARGGKRGRGIWNETCSSWWGDRSGSLKWNIFIISGALRFIELPPEAAVYHVRKTFFLAHLKKLIKKGIKSFSQTVIKNIAQWDFDEPPIKSN